MPIRSGRVAVNKSEQLLTIETNENLHFTEAIAQYSQETESLTGLSDNKVFIRSVNIQSIQNLEYRLIFWAKDTFANTTLNVDSYIDDVILDMSDTENAFRINNTGQHYLNISKLEIPYEDEDETKKLHISLQNLSPTSKNAGAAGAVQMDIEYTPRL